MADFLPNLWESVFTPGTTPTLLVATNAAFGSLQVLLALLLVATHSIHFAILSVLCGGLWYSINWFAQQVEIDRAAGDRERELSRRKKRGEKDGRDSAEDGAENADDEGEDTEVEGGMRESAASLSYVSADDAQPGQPTSESAGDLDRPGGFSSSLHPSAAESDTRRRKTDEGDRGGDISTDSEWEKIEGEH